MVKPRRDGSGRGHPDPGHQPTARASSPADTESLARDLDRLAALDRLHAQADHTRVCRWLHQLAPLTVHYGPRRVAA